MLHITIGLIILLWIYVGKTTRNFQTNDCDGQYTSGSLVEPCGLCAVCITTLNSLNQTIEQCTKLLEWIPHSHRPFVAIGNRKKCFHLKKCNKVCHCEQSECVELYGTCKCVCNTTMYGQTCDKVIPYGLSMELFADFDNIIYEPYIYSTDFAQFHLYLYSTGINLKIKVATKRETLLFNEKGCNMNSIPSKDYCMQTIEISDILGTTTPCKSKPSYKGHFSNKGCSLIINLAFPQTKLEDSNKKQFVISYPNIANTSSVDNIVAKSEDVTISIVNEILNVSHEIFNQTYGLLVFYVGKSLLHKCNPQVKINQLGSKMNNMNTFSRRQKITVTSSVVIDENHCEIFGDPTLKWFVWVITQNHDEKSDLPFIQKEGISVLEFPPYSIWYGVYKVKHEVILKTKYFSIGTAYCYFEIVPLPLDPSIIGGSLRYIYYKDNLELITSSVADPNYPLHEQPQLQYEWYCNDTRDSICQRQQAVNSYNTFGMLVLTLHSPFTPDKAYSFTMEVISPNSSSVDFSNQVIIISPEPIPSLLIECLWNCGGNNYKSDVKEMFYFRVYHSQYSVPMSKQSVYKWTYSTGKEQYISVEGIRQDEETPSWILIIKENILNTNELYTLKVIGGGLRPGEAQITVKTWGSVNVNSFQCTIIPQNGIAGKTKFQVNCELQNDEMLFTFYDKNSKDDETGRLLCSSYTGVAEDVILTRGQVLVKATNKYGQVKETTLSVSLQQVEATLKFLKESIQEIEELSRGEGYEQKVSFISAIEDILHKNTVMKQIAMEKLLEIISKEKANTIVDLELLLSTTLSVICFKDDCTMPLMDERSYHHLVQILSGISKKLTSLLIKSSNIISVLPSFKLQRIIYELLKCSDVLLNTQDKTLDDREYSIYKLYKYGNLKIMKSLNNINIGLAVHNLPYLKSTSVQSESIDSYMKEDVPNYFTKSKGNSLMRMSSKLAESLSVEFDTIVVQTMNFKNNPYWWYPSDQVTTDVLSLNIGYVIRSNNTQNYQNYTSIDQLKYPIDIFLNIHTFQNDSINGSVSQPDPAADPDVKDLAVAVHKLYPLKGSVVSVRFVDLRHNDVFQVAIELNQRPDYDMIQERGINITSLSPWYTFSKEIINEDDFIFMGILPGSNVQVGNVVNYKFEIQSARCQFWYDLSWSTSGCKLGNESTEHRLHCQCNHLSFITGRLRVPMNTVNPFEDYKLFLTIPDNPYVFTFVTMIFIVYIILLIWSCNKNRQDRLKTNLIILEDNITSDMFGYLLIVCTGSRLFAGTSSNIGIILHGTKYSSRPHILRSSNRATLKRSSDDWFLLYAPKYLGIISSIQLWTDHSGPTPNWFCDRIYIHDLNSKDDYAFVVSQWFGITHADICVEEFIRPITFEKNIYISSYILTNAISGFRESHVLVSIVWAYPRSPVSKSQRLSVLMTALMVTLLTSIMFYDVAIPQVEDVPSYHITMQEALISIYSLIIASVVTGTVAFMFKMSYVKKKKSKKVNVQVKNQRKIKVDRLREDTISVESSNNLIMYYLYRFILSLRKKNFFPMKPATDAHEYITIKKVRLTFAWVFCIIVIVLNSYFIILYGLKFGKVKSLLWLTSIGLSFGGENIIIDPLKIIMISVLFGILQAQFCDMYTYDPNIHEIRNKSNLKIEINKDINNLIFRQKPYYKHMSRKRIQSILKQQQRIKKWWALLNIVDICFPAFFMFLLVCWYGFGNYNNSLFERLFLKYVQTDKMYASLPMISNSTRYLQYIENTILPAIYSKYWYNKLSLTSELEAFEGTGWTVDTTHRIIGVPRVRQIRVRQQHCVIPHLLQNVSTYCNVRFSPSTEDTKNYGTFWKGSAWDDILFETSPWMYNSPENSSSITIYSKSGQSFHGGGYLAELSRTQSKSEDILFNLIDSKWLDWRTHVVFLEMTSYNVNVNVFSSIIFFAEMLECKLILEGIQIMSFFARNEYILLEILGVLYSILGITKLIMVFNNVGLSFFMHFWPVYDLILILIALICLVYYRLFLITASAYIRGFQNSGKDTSFQFQKLSISLNTAIYLLTILFTLINVRLLRLIEYGNGNTGVKQIRAITKSWFEILWVTLFLILFISVFQQLIVYLVCQLFFIENTRYFGRYANNICTYLPYSLLKLAMFIYMLIIVKAYTQVSSLKKRRIAV